MGDLDINNFNKAPEWNPDHINNDYQEAPQLQSNIEENQPVISDTQAQADNQADDTKKTQGTVKTQKADTPVLEQPNVPQNPEEAKEYYSTLNNQTTYLDIGSQTFAKMISDFTANHDTPDAKFNMLMNQSLFKDVPPEDLAKALMEFGSPELAGGNPDITKMINTLKEKIAQQTGGTAQPDPQTTEASLELLKMEGADIFTKELKNKKLSQDEQKQLEYVFSHPEEADKLPKHLQKMFKEIMGEVKAQLTETYGLNEAFEPEASKFNKKLNAGKLQGDYDNNFEEAVKEYALANNLTEEQTHTLISMHYFPKGEFPNADELRTLYQQIDTKVMNELLQEFGAPAGAKGPSPDTKSYEVMQTGRYFVILQKLVDKMEGLSKSDKKDIMTAAVGMGAFVLSEKLQKKLDSASAKALEAIIQEEGLPSDWRPTITTPTTMMNNPQYKKLLGNGMEVLNEAFDSAQKIYGDVGDKVNSANYGELMMKISLMLDMLQQAIYALLTNDAKTNNTLGKMQLDIKMNQLEKQAQQIEEARKQIEKQQAMGWLQPLMYILLIVVCFVMMGPLGLIFAALMITLMETHALEKLFELLDQLIEKIFGKNNPFTVIMQTVVKVLVMILLVAVVSFLGPVAMLMMFFQAFQDSKVVQNIAIACGASEETANWIAMGIQMAMMVAVIIICFVVPVIAPGLAASMTASIMPAAFAQMTSTLGMGLGTFATQLQVVASQVGGRVAQVLEQIVQWMLKNAEMLKKVMDCITMGAMVTQTVMQGAKQISDIVVNLMLAELARKKGEIEADLEVIQGILTILRQIISNFQAAIDGNGSWANDVNTMQGKKWKELSAAMTGLFSA